LKQHDAQRPTASCQPSNLETFPAAHEISGGLQIDFNLWVIAKPWASMLQAGRKPNVMRCFV